MKATTMTVKVIAHFCTGEIGSSDAESVIAGVLLGVRPKVGEPLVVGRQRHDRHRGEWLRDGCQIEDRVRRHRYGQLHRRETVGAEHERLPLAQDRQGEPWNATPCQLRSDEVIEAVCGERRRKRRTQDREDYDTSILLAEAQCGR